MILPWTWSLAVNPHVTEGCYNGFNFLDLLPCGDSASAPMIGVSEGYVFSYGTMAVAELRDVQPAPLHPRAISMGGAFHAKQSEKCCWPIFFNTARSTVTATVAMQIIFSIFDQGARAALANQRADIVVSAVWAIVAAEYLLSTLLGILDRTPCCQQKPSPQH